jgi:hypothetical protein
VRLWTGPLLLAASLLLVGEATAGGADRLGRFYRGYPAEALEPVAGEPPASVRVLPPDGPSRWPERVREPLEARVHAEWPRGHLYGPVQTGVGLWLTYPLVTGREGSRLLVPATPSPTLPIRGVVDLPDPPGARRVVLLLDASSSANATTLFRTARGRAERISVLDAERRSLRHLLQTLEGIAGIEIGVVTYGETTRVLAEPGTPHREILAQLERWEAQEPSGTGRTDLVCALEVARDRLRDAPDGLSREVLLLTDGDLPHSGRFSDCRQRSKEGRKACRARANRSPCPARHHFRERDGYSDLVQLERFGRRAKGHLSVYAVVFDATRPARPYLELAEVTRGELFRVPSADRLESALPALVLRRVRSVRARNERTGEETTDLLDPATGRFEGRLVLAPGANDVLLTVHGESAPVAIHRFRIYSEPSHLERVLSELRERNRELELTVESNDATSPGATARRRLAIEPEPLPGAPAGR